MLSLIPLMCCWVCVHGSLAVLALCRVQVQVSLSGSVRRASYGEQVTVQG